MITGIIINQEVKDNGETPSYRFMSQHYISLTAVRNKSLSELQQSALPLRKAAGTELRVHLPRLSLSRVIGSQGVECFGYRGPSCPSFWKRESKYLSPSAEEKSYVLVKVNNFYYLIIKALRSL